MPTVKKIQSMHEKVYSVNVLFTLGPALKK